MECDNVNALIFNFDPIDVIPLATKGTLVTFFSLSHDLRTLRIAYVCVSQVDLVDWNKTIDNVNVFLLLSLLLLHSNMKIMDLGLVDLIAMT